MKQILAIMALLLCTGCAKKPVVAVHPGAISNIDSYAYDVLIVEQDAINNAKAAFTAGTLPQAAHDPLNVAIRQFNIAEQAWQGYHAAGGDSTVLQQAISALVSAMGELQKVLNKPGPQLMGPPVSAIFFPEVIYG